MATVFSKIINGELPGTFVYRDEVCVVFLSIEPITPGHLLVVPVEEYENYWDAPAAVWTHMNEVAQAMSRALLTAYPQAKRVGLMVAGFDVPHLHIHLVALEEQGQLSFAGARPATPQQLATEAEKIRAVL
ncbi:MAG: HIT family protein [Varibaculum sp.]|nr:HIT family protein [Varibaculum sp.]